MQSRNHIDQHFESVAIPISTTTNHQLSELPFASTMLSNPPQASGLHSRQRQHRRQNSTPSAFEAVKIAPLPNFQQQQQRPNVSHRRGLSLDTRRPQLSPTRPTTTLRQDYTTVSNTTTNPGLSTTPQHVLRETQQQRINRPGHGQPSMNIAQHQQLQQQSTGDEFLVSPHGAQLHPQYVDAMAAQGQMADLSGLPFDTYMGPMSAMLKKNQAHFANNNAMIHTQVQEFEFFGPDSALSTPTFMTFPDTSPAGSGQGWISEGETTSAHSRRSSRRISNGILDKVSKFESMGNGNNMNASVQRPITPPGHNMNAYFPPTTTETPHSRMMKHEADQQQQQQRPNRFADDYDESLEETIKPVRGNRPSNRNSGIFQDLRQQAESEMVQTPPRANTMPMAFTEQGLRTPDFMNMNNLNAEFVKIEHGYDGLPTGHLSISSDMSSHASPLTSSMANLGGLSHHVFDQKPDLRSHLDFDSQNTIMPHHTESPSHMGSGSMSPSRGSAHRRTDSIASIASAASIASINIDDTKTDTGVTTDDIAIYIEGPDASDGKWVCLFDNCQKRFGRKENIKSHVQTHLNDRQYQCPTCKKCFVRQHDLKRHAKIHTGIKPYPCQCGNSFARHDALTRHRQRGMCIGAFEGITRKVVKRGRPRKNRPDLDERREKSERTRRKNTKHTSTSSMSSHSGYSDSSAVNSPSNEFDNLLDEDPFPDMMDVAMGEIIPSSPPLSTMNPNNLTVSTAPMPTPTPMTLDEPPLSVMSPGAGPGPAIHHRHQEIIDLDQIENNPNPNPPVSTTSPSYSHHTSPLISYTTLAPEYTTLPTLPTLPPSSPGSKSITSQYTHIPCTPPELSSSSSPPPSSSTTTTTTTTTTTHTTRFFDMEGSNTGDDDDDDEEGNISGLSDASIGLGTTLSAHAAADDLMMQFSGGLDDVDDIGAGLVYHHHQQQSLGGLGGHHQGMMMGSGGGKYGGVGGVDVVNEGDHYNDAVNMSLFMDSEVLFGN